MPKKRHWFFDSHKYQVRPATVSEYADGEVIKTHAHPWHQLIYASQGVMAVHTSEGEWVVPIHRGVWLPAGACHSIEMSGNVSLRTLYLVPRLSKLLPDQPCVIGVSPLLRELILQMVELGSMTLRNPAHAHLIAVLLDHLHEMKGDALHLPLPRDGRARRIASALQREPSDKRRLSELSTLVGASKRTIERRFKSETGMGFGKWRQQLRLAHALKLLAAGDAVTTVALDVGYDSVSAFIAAFRITFGRTPSQYFRPA
jgi:AraC-like DNA-binding protein